MENSARAIGFRSLSIGPALDSMTVSILSDEPHLFVGLDGENPNIQRLMGMESLRTQKLTTYLAAQTTLDPTAGLAGRRIASRHGGRALSVLVARLQIPRVLRGRGNETY